MPYIIAVIVAVVLGIGFTLFQSNKAPTQTPEPTPITETTKNTPTAVTYKDGVYKANTSYRAPTAADYTMDVNLTVTNGTVTDAAITYGNGAEKDPNVQRFEDAYKTEVIGKSLGTINLSRVGGASLTTNAFNTALTEIKKQAQS
jgi:uncharacterized protein with FMN-binding domain